MKLEWEYSRSRHLNFVDDGERYGTDFHYLFEIRDCAPIVAYRQVTHKREHGYRLLFKGEHADAHKVVKVLKEQAQHLANKL